MAIERYVRRRWPEILVAWTRLLSGEFRDPLVARNIGFDCSLFFPRLSRRLPADHLTSTGRLILRSWQTNAISVHFLGRQDGANHETSDYLSRRRPILRSRMPEPAGLYQSGQDAGRSDFKHTRSYRGIYCGAGTRSSPGPT